jgi:hypothetical protein
MDGRKTYLVSGVVLLTLLLLVFLGELTPDIGVGLMTVAVCGFGATFRHALERHQQEEIAILRSLAQAGAAVANHNTASALQAGETTATLGAKLADEIKQEES